MKKLRNLLFSATAASIIAAPVAALDDDDVRELGEKCEAVRSEALAPIRERKTPACIEQQLRSKGHCERYYRTYGNVGSLPTGAPSQGYFYDLPECQEWLKAREELRLSRSRP